MHSHTTSTRSRQPPPRRDHDHASVATSRAPAASELGGGGARHAFRGAHEPSGGQPSTQPVRARRLGTQTVRAWQSQWRALHSDWHAVPVVGDAEGPRCGLPRSNSTRGHAIFTVHIRIRSRVDSSGVVRPSLQACQTFWRVECLRVWDGKWRVAESGWVAGGGDFLLAGGVWW